MAIFSVAKETLKIVGILAVPEEKLPVALQKHQTTINYLHMFLVISWLTCYSYSALHFILFEATSFAQMFGSSLYIIVNILRTIVYIVLVLNIKKMSAQWDEAETTIDKQSHFRPEIRIVYEQENAKCERFATKFRRFMMGISIISVLPKFVISLYRYFILDLGEKSFQLIVLLSIPWNWTNLYGYLLAVFVQYSWLCGGVFISVSVMLPFSAFCTSTVAFTLDIKQQLTHLNDAIISAQQNFTAANRIDMHQRLAKIIEFHSYAKEFKDRFTKVYNLVILLFFGLSSAFVCSSLISLNKAVEMQNTIEIIRAAIFYTIQVIYIGFFCHFGYGVTIAFETINDSIYECAWNECPVDIQKIQSIIMVFSQKQVHVRGYMNTQCNREMFKKLINATFSYFSMLRSIDR